MAIHTSQNEQHCQILKLYACHDEHYLFHGEMLSGSN